MKLNYARLIATSVGALLAGVLAEPAAQAAWDFVPNLDIRAQQQDNPRYVPDNASVLKDSASSAMLDLGLEMATYTDRGSLVFAPDVIAYRYAGSSNDDLESTDWYLKGTGQYSWRTAQ